MTEEVVHIVFRFHRFRNTRQVVRVFRRMRSAYEYVALVQGLTDAYYYIESHRVEDA